MTTTAHRLVLLIPFLFIGLTACERAENPTPEGTAVSAEGSTGHVGVGPLGEVDELSARVLEWLQPANPDGRQCKTLTPGGRASAEGLTFDWTTWSPESPVVSVTADRGEEIRMRAAHVDQGNADRWYIHDYFGVIGHSDGMAEFKPSVLLPAAGRWVFAVSAGGQLACFEVTATSAALIAPPTSIQAAELLARTPSNAPTRVPPSFRQSRDPETVIGGFVVGGTNERKCIEVGKIDDLRSGDWVIRPAAAYQSQWRAGVRGNVLKLVPLLQPSELATGTRQPTEESALMVAAREGDPSISYVAESPFFDGYTGNPSSDDLELAHLVPIHHPTAGRWISVFVGRSGSNWGCAVFDLR